MALLRTGEFLLRQTMGRAIMTREVCRWLVIFAVDLIDKKPLPSLRVWTLRECSVHVHQQCPVVLRSDEICDSDRLTITPFFFLRT